MEDVITSYINPQPIALSLPNLTSEELPTPSAPPLELLYPNRISELLDWCEQHKIDLSDANSEFICPISLEIMVDPYISASGYNYDTLSLLKWYYKHDTEPISKILPTIVVGGEQVPNKNIWKNL